MTCRATKEDSGGLLISRRAQELLRCPVCKGSVEMQEDAFKCLEPKCGGAFPIVDGLPVLINESNSVFAISDFVNREDTFFSGTGPRRMSSFLRRITPAISKNTKGKVNYRKLGQLLLEQSSSPLDLILGGSVLGEGMSSLLALDSVELVETDVSFGPRSRLICDAHDIPFADEAFDAVIVQAVLEHVVDPYRCVAEIHRVLKKDALVYAEVPFMQQVHAPPYDFTRFSHYGLRRLFRRFDMMELEICLGPGTALAWAYQYFLLSFSRRGGNLIRLFAGLTAWYLRYLDRFLDKRPFAKRAACGLYLFCRKSDKVLSDKDLIKLED